MISRLCLALVLLASTPAFGQITPQPTGGDFRLQTVGYDPAQVVQLRGAPGYQMTVELSPDEQVQNVSLGDSNAWQVSVNRRGDRLFIKPGQTPMATNMTVVTSVRVYNFELVPLSDASAGMPYTVRFTYPVRAVAQGRPGEFVDVSAARGRLSRYRMRGASVLLPSSISNDGYRTYVVWPKEKDLPATYEISPSGEEMLTNGMMRNDVLVIDRVVTRLLFRRDRLAARADLILSQRKR